MSDRGLELIKRAWLVARSSSRHTDIIQVFIWSSDSLRQLGLLIYTHFNAHILIFILSFTNVFLTN